MPTSLPTLGFPTVSRRELLRIGGASLLGLSLPKVLEAQEGGKGEGITPKADAMIVIHLNGGPSHLDMWDMKPDAPEGIRGEFKPISTSLPGVQFSEHLPGLAKLAHQCTLVRSMFHSVNNAHAAAVYTSLTGHDRGEIGGGTLPTDNPSLGSVAAMVRPTPASVVSHACLPYMTKEGANGPPQPGFFGGWMGRGYDPLWITKDPNAADFSVPELTLQTDVSADRVAARGQLLTEFNARLAGESRGTVEALNRFQRRALDVLTSDASQGAFRLDREPTELRDAYGRNIYGQSVLLARRLIEAGTRVVTVSWAPDANATWDTHGSNFKKLKGTLLPQFDAACSTLINDLVQRGLFDRTLVAVLGDFGRTPKVNASDGGRDHWNYCYTLMLAGGGIRRGFVYGASDKTGAFPADRPTAPGDIIATLYQLLGIDHRRELFDRFARPHRIVPKGDVVAELIA